MQSNFNFLHSLSTFLTQFQLSALLSLLGIIKNWHALSQSACLNVCMCIINLEEETVQFILIEYQQKNCNFCWWLFFCNGVGQKLIRAGWIMEVIVVREGVKEWCSIKTDGYDKWEMKRKCLLKNKMKIISLLDDYY